VVALLTLLATRHSLPIGALLAVLGLCLSMRGAPFGAGLAALPAMLAAMAPAPTPGLPPPRGPVAIAGDVLRVRRDPAADEFEVWVRTAGGPLRLVTGTACRPLPGDRLAATARCSAPAIAGGAPRLRAEAAAVQVAPGPWSVQR